MLSSLSTAHDPGRGHIPVARISALAAVAVGTFLVLRTEGGPHWRTLGPGVEFAMLRGEPFCRHGSADIAALRLDPARARLKVLNYSLTDAARPPDILEWQQRTGAIAVFNAGQFYPDWSYMGLLICSGHVVSPDVHPAFKAALVAAPESGAPAIRVLDLDRQTLDPRRPGWREVAQSFMLFDRSGTVRVRRTDHVSNRTVVLEDKRGRVVVLTTEGGYTLADLAEWVQRSPLQAVQAMAMDGGYEAELCVRTSGFRYASFGRWDGSADPPAPGARTPLPSVVTVESE
jgi:hypothetical protein